MLDGVRDDSDPAERNGELKNIVKHEGDVRSNANLGLVESVDVERKVICKAKTPENAFETSSKKEDDKTEIKRDNDPDSC